VPDEVVRKVLQFITRGEFESVVSDWDRLRALGIVENDETIDYDLVLKILGLASRGKFLKNAILRFVIQEFRDDLRNKLHRY